jgi:rRNA maturation endonuclease Nob1
MNPKEKPNSRKRQMEFQWVGGRLKLVVICSVCKKAQDDEGQDFCLHCGQPY